MKLKYETTLIGGIDHNLNPKIILKDETLFTHNSNNEQIWVIGGIETMDKKLRIIAIKSMDSEAIKNFVNDNFMEGTHFTYYKWAGYNFLSNNIHLLMKVITMEGRFWEKIQLHI